MKSVAIIGQSLGSFLWEQPSSGLTPLPNTQMRLPGGAWQPPINRTITFCNELATVTGEPVNLLAGAVGGSGLLSVAASPNGYWLDRAAGSPLSNFLGMLPGIDLVAINWIQGQNEAYGTAPIATERYLAGLIELYAIICGAAGKVIGDIPFKISPINNVGMTQWGRYVLAAQYEADKFPGMSLGPEYWDLPTQADGVHLSDAGFAIFATRLADADAPHCTLPYYGSTTAPTPPPPPPPPPPSGTWTTIQNSTLTNDSGPNYAGRSLRSPAAASPQAASQIMVTIEAANGSSLNIDNASVGIQSSGLATKATPIPLSFNGSPGVSIAAGQTAQGIASLAINAGDIPVVIIDINAAGTQNFRYYEGTGAAYYANGASYNLAAPSGFTTYGSGRYFGIKQVDVQ